MAVENCKYSRSDGAGGSGKVTALERAGRMHSVSSEEVISPMKLKKHGAFLVNFVVDFADGNMSRQEFDMDYSGYVIEHFPEFEKEHPRLSRRFADTIDRTYSTCSWMTHDAFQYAISDALDLFLGTAPEADIY